MLLGEESPSSGGVSIHRKSFCNLREEISTFSWKDFNGFGSHGVSSSYHEVLMAEDPIVSSGWIKMKDKTIEMIY